MGKIFIEGLSVDTLIGVYDWERERLTELSIDIELEAELDKAMASDDVMDTIDYAKVANCVAQVGKESQFELLEAFGAKVMDTVLQQFPVQGISIKIVKPGILPNARRVAVALSRART